MSTINGGLHAAAEEFLKARGRTHYTPDEYLDAIHEAEAAVGALAYVLGETSIDVNPLLDQELTALGDPLPAQVASAGPGGVDQLAQRILRERGIQRYTADQYRQAVGDAVRELSSSAAAPASGRSRPRPRDGGFALDPPGWGREAPTVQRRPERRRDPGVDRDAAERAARLPAPAPWKAEGRRAQRD
jgi:hypothetical protein